MAETVSSLEGLAALAVYTDNLPSKFKAEARKLALAFGTLPSATRLARLITAARADG